MSLFSPNKAFSNVLRKAGLVLPFIALAVLSAVLFPRYTTSFRYHCEVGKPWAYDLVTAEFDFPIYKTSAQLAAEERQLLETFAPCFMPVGGGQWAADKKVLPIISYEDRDWMEQEGYSRLAVISNHVSTTYLLEEVLTEKTAYERFGVQTPANIALDTAMTNRLKTKLLASIAPTQGIVQTGEKIIDRGEIVTERDYQILQSLRRACEEDTLTQHQRIWSIIGEAVLVTLFLFLFMLYLYVFRPAYINNLRTVLFFCLLSGIVIVLSCLTLRYTDLSIYLIPFAWVPILTRVFFDARTGLFLHFTTVLIVSLIAPQPVQFFFIQVAVGMVAVSSLSDMTRRAQLAQTAAWIFVTQTLAYTAFTFAATGDYHTLEPMTYLYFFVNALLIIGSYGLIYLFEKMFRFISSITLIELTDINSDLLHTMAEQAPGTFQHSMQVSNLATEAAKAIGANALLVRTGALYHDIGKLRAPLYFTENQQGGPNPLLTMSPQEAAQEVIKHITEGEEMARKHHLPEMIINFITTHHGTTLTRYFYNTYANAHPGEEVDKMLFQYPGPKPTTKEAAILMMADAVEARSRSLTDYSEEAIARAVDQMIDQQIADGQFAETPLSFKDVEDIRRVFKERISTINHHRIAYPTLNR
ncbi:MAG: HD family phosphohydrolase [Paludibacteraceae bacterium]